MVTNNSDSSELRKLCNNIRELVEKGEYEEGKRIVSEAMSRFPHAAEPHNLMGVLLENGCDHLTAMKHFRAAWSLDPAYIPARYNMAKYADVFYKTRKTAFDETDCEQEDKESYKTVYDDNGVGHIIKRNINK